MKFIQDFPKKRGMILFSMMAFLLLSACASTQTMSMNESLAYKAARAGKTADARNLLKQESDNSRRSFMLACLELSDGNLNQARHYADQFIEREPNVADGKVLRELIEQRKTRPAEPWPVSFATAWKASGSPMMTVSNLFIKEPSSCEEAKKCEQRGIPEAIRGTPAEMLVAIEYGVICDTERFVKLCLSNTSPESPLPIKLYALSWLNRELSVESDKMPDDLLKRAQKRKQEVLKELSLERPLDMSYAVMTILSKTSDKEHFSLEDIDRLEEASSRPQWSLSPEELYKDYLRCFIALGSEEPYEMATISASDAAGTISYLTGLRKKILATAESASPETKRRLGAFLQKMGRAEVRSGMLIDLLYGISLLYTAAELRDDEKANAQVKVVHEFTIKLLKGEVFNATIASQVWPILPLLIESNKFRIKNEIDFHKLFTDIDPPVELLELLKD